MSKRTETPAVPVRLARLIAAGGAKARTNAGSGVKVIEEFPLQDFYDPN